MNEKSMNIKAITLVELLLSIAVLGTVLICIHSLFQSGIVAYAFSNENLNLLNSSRMTEIRLKDDLYQAQKSSFAQLNNMDDLYMGTSEIAFSRFNDQGTETAEIRWRFGDKTLQRGFYDEHNNLKWSRSLGGFGDIPLEKVDFFCDSTAEINIVGTRLIFQKTSVKAGTGTETVEIIICPRN